MDEMTAKDKEKRDREAQLAIEVIFPGYFVEF
jgi:hypothetical protein